MPDKSRKPAATKNGSVSHPPLAPKERVWRETPPSGATNVLQQLVQTAHEFEKAVFNGQVSSPATPPEPGV